MIITSVLVESHLKYIRTQQFECLKRLRAHLLHIDLALQIAFNKFDNTQSNFNLSACTPFVSLTISLLSELVKSRTLE